MELSYEVLDGVPTVKPELLIQQAQGLVLVDVRGAEEWVGELGILPQAQKHTLGEPLTDYIKQADQDKTYVFICRSGGRSARATQEAREFGLKAYNMQGGMIRWNELGGDVANRK